MFKKYIKDVGSEFKGYNLDKLVKDIMAGITVGAVALPLALAFGVSSGGTAGSGLVSTIVAGVIMSIFSGGSFQISGPTATMCGILFITVAHYGMQGMFIVNFFAGIFLIVCAFFKIGKLIALIPNPVILGFTSGISLLIAFSQLDNFLGVKSIGINPIEKILSYFTNPFNPNYTAIFIGVLTITIMLITPKRVSKIIPLSLLAIIISTIVSLFMGEVALVGEIPSSILLRERLSFASFEIGTILALISPAFTICLLCMIESVLSGTCGSRMKGDPFTPDMEMFAQGVGNMVIPFFGGIPASAVMARTSVAIKSGGQTRLTGVFHGVAIMLAMMFCGNVIAKIPLCALAGVLFVTSVKMNDFESIKYYFDHKFKGASAKFIITMACTVVFDLTTAILIGVTVSIVILIVKLSDIDINSAEIDFEKLKDSENISHKKMKESVVIYITGPIFFASLDKVREKILEHEKANIIILSLRGVPIVDATAVRSLVELCNQMESENKKIIFSGVQPKVKVTMERSGVVSIIGDDKFYWSVEEVLNDQKLFAD